MAQTSVIYDHTGTVVRTIHFDPTDPYAERTPFTIQTTQDLEPMWEDIAAARDAPKGKNMVHVATVPVEVVELAMREGWFNDQKAWNRFLNDIDNRDFRVHGGHL